MSKAVINRLGNALPYLGKRELLVKDQKTSDIVTAIRKFHKAYNKDYDSIADQFWAGSVADTARFLFDFLKKHIVYDVEPQEVQTVKSPGAIIAEKHGDCKHYASFITGIANALERQGHPIHAFYRFVADNPGSEVHHVFSVITDKNTGKEYWVDPVLKTFDTRPKFYNTKDFDMALYSVSGTNYGVSMPQVGDSDEVGNIFKKLGKGIQNAVHKVEHSVQVNTANAGKGIQHQAHALAVNAKNAGKGVQKAAQAVEHIAVKVAAAPARNAFLALLDLNAFNLATRMSEAIKSHKNEVLDRWRKIGGDPNKLINAINNGLKHKAVYHHQPPPKKVSGTDEVFFHFVRGGYPHRRSKVIDANLRHRMMDSGRAADSLHHAYQVGPNSNGRLPVVSGIGEPVSLSTLIALASAIIGAFAGFMHQNKEEQQNMALAANAGSANLVQTASDMQDAAAAPGGPAMLQDVAAASNGQGMIVSTGIDPATGVPAVAVQAVDHPQLNNAGYAPGGPVITDDDVTTTDPKDLSNIPKKLGNDFFNSVTDTAKMVWEGYKTPIIFIAGGIIVYKVATRKKRRR